MNRVNSKDPEVRAKNQKTGRWLVLMILSMLALSVFYIIYYKSTHG